MTAARKETWVVIADGMRARMLKWGQDRRFSRALDQELYEPAVHGFARDLKSDAPGRAFDTGSGARHAIEPRHDPHELAKVRFERHVAMLLDDAAGRDAFDRLILVAPPRPLGVLRETLTDRVRKRVVAEVHKDLVHTPFDELAGHLKDVLDV